MASMLSLHFPIGRSTQKHAIVTRDVSSCRATAVSDRASSDSRTIVRRQLLAHKAESRDGDGDKEWHRQLNVPYRFCSSARSKFCCSPKRTINNGAGLKEAVIEANAARRRLPLATSEKTAASDTPKSNSGRLAP